MSRKHINKPSWHSPKPKEERSVAAVAGPDMMEAKPPKLRKRCARIIAVLDATRPPEDIGENSARPLNRMGEKDIWVSMGVVVEVAQCFTSF